MSETRNKPRYVPCPVNGCRAKVQPPLVFCPPHLDRLPEQERLRLEELLASDPHSASAHMAIEAAKTELEQQESD